MVLLSETGQIFQESTVLEQCLLVQSTQVTKNTRITFFEYLVQIKTIVGFWPKLPIIIK